MLALPHQAHLQAERQTVLRGGTLLSFEWILEYVAAHMWMKNANNFIYILKPINPMLW